MGSDDELGRYKVNETAANEEESPTYTAPHRQMRATLWSHSLHREASGLRAHFDNAMQAAARTAPAGANGDVGVDGGGADEVHRTRVHPSESREKVEPAKFTRARARSTTDTTPSDTNYTCAMSEDDGGRNEEYGNKHRAFLQALNSRQTITWEEAKPIIAAIETCETPKRPTTPEDIAREDFESYIYTINNQISPFDYEIRSSVDQNSKERVYALINTTSDALTQMATVHTADEIAFVKRVLDAMFDTYNTRQAEVMAVTSMQALKLSKDPNRRETQTQSAQSGLTMVQAEKVLADMEAEGWFELSERGYYSLSPRALMELRNWLSHMYNDAQEEGSDDEEEPHEKIKNCKLCTDIVTTGQRCPNLPCNARLHNFCVRNMFRAQRDSEKCPTCGTDWKDAPPVGEKAAPRGGGGARRPVNGAGVRRSTNEAAGRRSEGLDEGYDSDADAGAEN